MKVFLKVSMAIVCFFSFQGFALSLPVVQNPTFEGATLVWDPVEGAAGYNIYLTAPGGQQAQTNYLSTVIGANSYEAEQTGGYTVIAFNATGTEFSDWSLSRSVYFDADNVQPSESVIVTYYNDTAGRYLVTTNCSGSRTECAAHCGSDGNSGNATGGFCDANDVISRAVGTQYQYTCRTSTSTNEIVVGVYCAAQ